MELKPMLDALGREVRPGDFYAKPVTHKYSDGLTLPLIEIVKVLQFVVDKSLEEDANVLRQFDYEIVRSKDPQRVGTVYRCVSLLEVPGEHHEPNWMMVKVDGP